MENKTAVVIPTYNEKENIEKLITNITKILPNLHIIVVDDNSPDDTYKIVEELSLKNNHIHLIKRPKKLGLGTAYISGFIYAEKEINAEYVITMDSDFSHDPNTIPTIIENLKDNDVVIGSRYTDGGVVVDSPKTRRLISKTANFFTKVFLKLIIKDATSGFRGYRISILKKIDYNNIFSDGYSFLIELIYRVSKLDNVKIKEIPITFFDRKEGKSKISKNEIFKAIKTISKLFIMRLIYSNQETELILTQYSLNLVNYMRLKFHISRYKKVKKLLKNGNILDIGCGKPAEFMCDMSFLIFLKNKDSTGIDIKEIENTKYNFIKSSVLDIPSENKKFDNVVAMELIEHIDNLEKAFSEIKRVMKDDGFFIIVTPDNNIIWQMVWSIWEKTFGKIWEDKHVSNYNKKNWTKIISKHFNIITIKRSYLFDLIFKCSKK